MTKKRKEKLAQEIVSTCPYPDCKRVELLYANGKTGSQESIVDFPNTKKELCFLHRKE